MIQIINISLIPSDNKPVINVSQYDNGLRVLRFNIFDDIEMEVPHEFDGETVTCNIRKNDNNIVVITGTIETETTEETETSFVQVVLTEQACACVGSNYGEISLSSGDDVIGTCNFKLVVERSPLAGGITSQSEIDNLYTQVEQIVEEVLPSVSLIDDDTISTDKTWSSEKISDELYALLPVGTANGSIASFNTALAKPLVSCVVDESATKLYHTSKYCEQFHGLVIGNFAFIELSQLNWQYVESNQAFIANVLNNIIKKPATTSVMPYFISSKYDVVQRSEVVFGTTDKVITEQVTGSVIACDLDYTNAQTFANSLEGEYLIYELETATTSTLTDAQFETLINAFDMSGNVESLPLTEMPITYIGDNNFFTDYGDTTVQYKDTINNYIDTRVNAVSSRSLSMIRTIANNVVDERRTLDVIEGGTEDEK